MSDASREALGMLVRAVWVAWAREQPDPKPSWLAGWAELDEGQREVDMRIGEAVAAAERERLLNRPASRIEPDPDQRGYNRGVLDIDAAIAQAVAAERERIAELATRKRAVYCKPCDGAPCSYDDELAPFADLIRSRP